MRPANLVLLLAAVASALFPPSARANASAAMPEVSLAVVERAIERVWAAAEVARQLEERRESVVAERNRLRIELAEAVERLELLAIERNEAEHARKSSWRAKEIHRELLANVVLGELRRSRGAGPDFLAAPVALRGEVELRSPRVTTAPEADDVRGRLSKLQSDIDWLSSVTETIRADLARAEAQLERVSEELREARFRLEDAERRRIATAVSLEQRARKAEEHAAPGVSSLPPLDGKSVAFGPTPSDYRFRLPLRGFVAQRFGDRRDGQRSRGLVVSADRPQPIVAPARGIVAYAGRFRDMGLLLIIEHGDAYHSLVIGASRLEVQAGDVVTEGQAVGWLERSPSGSMDLYFELRRVGEPVDPMPVLSAHDGEVEG
jgi:septal ring factor EnvC (AmiA/AmiB activator)